MTNTATFIAPIYRIAVSEALGRGDKLDDFLWLTNDADLVRSRIPARLVQHIGTGERDGACNAGLVVYGEFSGDLYPSSTAAANTLIATQLLRLHEFVQMLWIIKDNAANVENGFLSGPDGVCSRIWTMTCTLADGTDSVTTFSREELRTARTLYRNVWGTASLNADEFNKTSFQEVVEPDAVPLSRAIFFLGAARSSSQLSVKIANYCSALESLLITSPTELTYRLCQRVAWLLGESTEERYELFQRLKDGYDFRSKVVHGSYTSAKKLRNDLLPSVRACDTILRGVLGQVLEDEVLRAYVLGHAKNSDSFEERLVRITLGAEPSGKTEK
jgi:hypothetical protein